MVPDCPDHLIPMVQSATYGIVECQAPGCEWFYGARRGSFIVEATIERSEELRVDRLGPTEDDVKDESIPLGEERPSRTLG